MRADIWIEEIRKSGCPDFLTEDAGKAVDEVLRAVPQAAGLMTGSAIEELRRDYIERLFTLYTGPVAMCVREKIRSRDMMEYAALTGDNPEAIRAAASETRMDLLKDSGRALREEYPLAQGYENVIKENYLRGHTELLSRIAADRREISGRLLGGREFSRIEHISSDGADAHRQGRVVAGITTDAGTFFYKPHNCSLDAFYNEVVGRWFSDITIAPDVIDKGEYAFVSCLKHSEVRDAGGVETFFYNFGCLTALFHGLGSNDMHMDNIISCGDRPCAVDIENIIGTGSHRAIKTAMRMAPFGPVEDYNYSVYGTGIMPGRIHKAGLLSPLHKELGTHCLPRCRGKAYTVSGRENTFIQGFRDGYRRLSDHKDEIIALLERYSKSTVRVLVRNTVYYYIIRGKLFSADALKSEAARDRELDSLRTPYEVNGSEADPAIIEYEKKCLLSADIPYYCTGIHSRDLCGSGTDQIIREEYLDKTAAEVLRERMSRITDAEAVFEEDIIRDALTDVLFDDTQEDKTACPVSSERISREQIAEELEEMIDQLEQHAIRHTDGHSISWVSKVLSLENPGAGGIMSGWADAGLFCGLILRRPELSSLHEKAKMLAGHCLDCMKEFAEIRLQPCGTDAGPAHESEDSGPGLSPGLGSGGSKILLALESLKTMDPAADELKAVYADYLKPRADRVISEKERATCNPWNVQRGDSGILIADSLSGELMHEDKVARTADRILESLPVIRLDGLKGGTGMAAALSYAFKRTGDVRYAEGAEQIFETVRDRYRSHINGWQDPAKPLSWATGKAPFAAGIALAAEYSIRALESGAARGKAPGGSRTHSNAAREVLRLAVCSLGGESGILRLDSLNDGNALTVLACIFMSDDQPEYLDRAGRILNSMVTRKQELGRYILTGPGITNGFDSSVMAGTIGIGCVMAAYLSKLQNFGYCRAVHITNL